MKRDRLSLLVWFLSLFLSPALKAQDDLVATISEGDSGTQIEWEGKESTAYWAEVSAELLKWQRLPEVTLGRAGFLSKTVSAQSTDTFYRLSFQSWLLGEDFETDPRSRGWLLINQAREPFSSGGWSTAGVIQPDSMIWQSTQLTIPAKSYFRVDFSYTGLGSANVSSQAFNPALTWGRYPSAEATDGQLLEGDFEIWRSENTVQHGIFISRTSTHATSTAVHLHGAGVEFDDVVVTTLSDPEVLLWADELFSQMPSLNYEPPEGRHEHLGRTLSLLQNGQPLRILFVGDSLMQDAANSTLDLLLERRFPGSTLEIQAATGQGTGINKWNDDTNFNWPDQDLDIDNAIIGQEPDLVLLGGISNNFTDWKTSFPELIAKIRTRSITQWGSAPDILIMTGPPFYSPESDYSTDLEAIAGSENTAFLDLYAVIESYLATVGGGYTVADLKRDTFHANSSGKQLMGRILLKWLEPEPVALFEYARNETIVVEQSFADNPPGWDYSRTLIQNGELVAESGERWAEAVLPLDAEVPLTDRICNFYWEMRTDPAAGQDVSALHPKLHVTREASRFEQISLNTILRAGPFYMFYVDPGFLVDHPHERHPTPIPGFFDDALTTQKFRIRTEPVDSEHILAKFQYYDEANGQWSEFIDQFKPERSVDILVDIAADLEGYSTVRGLNFMFPHAVASVQATALGWEPISD